MAHRRPALWAVTLLAFSILLLFGAGGMLYSAPGLLERGATTTASGVTGAGLEATRQQRLRLREAYRERVGLGLVLLLGAVAAGLCGAATSCEAALSAPASGVAFTVLSLAPLGFMMAVVGLPPQGPLVGAALVGVVLVPSVGVGAFFFRRSSGLVASLLVVSLGALFWAAKRARLEVSTAPLQRQERPAPPPLPVDRAYQEICRQIDQERIRQWGERWSRLPSRLAGSAVCNQAADEVRRLFEAAGLAEVGELHFDLVIPVQKEAFLRLGNERYPLHAFWPNQARTCTVAPGRLKDVPVFYAARGRARDFNGFPLKDAVVILDNDALDGWTEAAAMGAGAVIYFPHRPLSVQQMQQKNFPRASLNFPRFWIQPEEGEQLLRALLGNGGREGDGGPQGRAKAMWQATEALQRLLDPHHLDFAHGEKTSGDQRRAFLHLALLRLEEAASSCRRSLECPALRGTDAAALRAALAHLRQARAALEGDRLAAAKEPLAAAAGALPPVPIPRGTLSARVDWVSSQPASPDAPQPQVYRGRNIYGFLWGTDPQLRRQIVVLEAHYDASSWVPTLAPGATEAVNFGLFLELLRYFSHHRPRRSLLFLATSGYHDEMHGMRTFCHAVAWSRKEQEKDLAELTQRLQRLKRLLPAISVDTRTEQELSAAVERLRRERSADDPQLEELVGRLDQERRRALRQLAQNLEQLELAGRRDYQKRLDGKMAVELLQDRLKEAAHHYSTAMYLERAREREALRREGREEEFTPAAKAEFQRRQDHAALLTRVAYYRRYHREPRDATERQVILTHLRGGTDELGRHITPLSEEVTRRIQRGELRLADAQRRRRLKELLWRHGSFDSPRRADGHFAGEDTTRETGLSFFWGLQLTSGTAQLGAFLHGFYYPDLVTTGIKYDLTQLAAEMGDWLYERAERVEHATELRPLVSLDVEGESGPARRGRARIYHDMLKKLDQGREWTTYLPVPIGFSGEHGIMSGIAALSWGTVNDECAHLDSPHDLMAQVHLENLMVQGRLIACLLDDFLNDPGTIPEVRMVESQGRMAGRVVFERLGSTFPDQPAAGAVAFCGFHQEEAPLGVRRQARALVEPDGTFLFPALGRYERRRGRSETKVEAFRLAPVTGEVIMAPNIAGAATRKYPNRRHLTATQNELTVVVFPCRPLEVYEVIDQRYFVGLSQRKVLDASREAEPLRHGLSDAWHHFAVFLEPNTRLKMTFKEGLYGLRMLLLNTSPREPFGGGYPVEPLCRVTFPNYETARDFRSLVDLRLRELERHGIRSRNLEAVHEEAGRSLAQADTARQRRNWSEFTDAANSAWAYGAAAYQMVEALRHSTVYGLLFYIFLLVPFAFCLERLLFECADFRWRVAVFLGLVLLTVAVLWQLHPAFVISAAPLVAILAFFILLMAALVMVILAARFEAEMKRRQRQSAGVEVADVNRLGAFFTAFTLGVSNMRRRPARTLLTIATLTFLTFTVVSFVSLEEMFTQYQVQISPDPPAYRGMLLRRRGYHQMSGIIHRTLENKYGHRYPVAPRFWRGAEKEGEQSYIDFYNEAGNRFTAKALLGLHPAEQLLRRPDGSLNREILLAGRFFSGSFARELIVPRTMADKLGLKKEALEKSPPQCRLFGSSYTVIGIFDGDRLDATKDLNGEAITPVDYTLQQSTEISQAEVKAEEDVMREIQEGPQTEREYEHVPGEQVVLLPCRTLESLGGTLRTLAVFITEKDPAQFDEIIRQMMRRLTLTLYIGKENGTWAFNALDVTFRRGLRDVLVPLVIAALIVLNTMLGCVHERLREIGIYSSVGLAPGHVAFLFLAEAVGLVVVSVMGGYLVAQVFAKGTVEPGFYDQVAWWGLLPLAALLGVFAYRRKSWSLAGLGAMSLGLGGALLVFGGRLSWLGSGLTLNYSSSAAVWAMALVMLVVMGSSLYPARMAFRLAVPEVMTRWRLPKTTGDEFVIPLPFFLAARDGPAIAMFLVTFFRAHREISLGSFCVTEAGIERVDGELGTGFEVRSEAWLAPFDLGLHQEVQISFVPADEPGFHRVAVTIRRESGEQAAWRRANEGFLNQLRKQFLIWRALPPQGRADFLARASGEPALAAALALLRKEAPALRGQPSA